MVNSNGTNHMEIPIPGACIEADISPDGRTLAFVSNDLGNFELYTCNIDGTNPFRVTDTKYDERGPKWSNDGRRIAFTMHDIRNNVRCALINPNGKSLRVIASNVDTGSHNHRAPAWSSDGRQVAFEASNIIYFADVRRGGAKPFSRGYARPAWSPDGTEMVLTGKSMFLFDVTTGLAAELYDGLGDFAVFNPAF